MSIEYRVSVLVPHAWGFSSSSCVCSVVWWSVSTICSWSGWPGTPCMPWRTTWTSASTATPPCESCVYFLLLVYALDIKPETLCDFTGEHKAYSSLSFCFQTENSDLISSRVCNISVQVLPRLLTVGKCNEPNPSLLAPVDLPILVLNVRHSFFNL